jgi:hypothetical protein
MVSHLLKQDSALDVTTTKTLTDPKMSTGPQDNAHIPQAQPILPEDDDTHTNSPSPLLKLLIDALGDEAYLFHRLPFEKAEFRDFPAQKRSCELPTQIKVGTLKNEGIPVWARLVKSSSTTRKSAAHAEFFEENEYGHREYCDRSSIHGRMTSQEAFPEACGRDMRPALAKYYFIEQDDGVNLPSPIEFSKTNQIELKRACRLFPITASSEAPNSPPLDEVCIKRLECSVRRVLISIK